MFEEIQIGIAAVEAELVKAGGEDKAKRAPRPRRGFAEHLERIDVVIEPEASPGCEGLDKVLIGEDVSERLDADPAQFRVIVTHRPKYAYKGFYGVLQVPAPAHPIEGGIPTEALLAHIAVAKYADGLLRSTGSRPSLPALASNSIARRRHGWASGLRTAAPAWPTMCWNASNRPNGSLPTRPDFRRSRLGLARPRRHGCGAYARDDSPFGSASPPMVAYRFEDSRGGECVARHL
ncbi:MAG: IS66 family transposase, partial [Mesorhizobium sp.]